VAAPTLPLGPRLRRRFYLELAGWCRTFRQHDNALRHYRAALALAPDDPLVLACMGFHLAQQGRRDEALVCFDRVIAQRPDDAEARFDRGFLLQEQGDHGRAIDAFRETIARNPDHDRAHYGLALSLIALRRLDEAVPPLERNTKLQPMSPYGWYQLARVQCERGKRDKAQAIVDHLARFEPKVAAQLARETGLRMPAR
jgi:tetratricopeptide (TPR) repeat protein